MEFDSTAKKDRHYICEIGRLLWGNNKQCYAADAVYRHLLSLLTQPGVMACGNDCHFHEKYGFVPEADCPIHDS